MTMTPRTLEEVLADPAEVRIKSLLEYIESNMRLIDNVTKNVRACTQQALEELAKVSVKTEERPSREGDWQSCYGCLHDVPIKDGKHMQANGATYVCYNLPSQRSDK